MSEVVSLYRESIIEFVRRHPAGVYTNDIAGRFGMPVDAALQKMKRIDRINGRFAEFEASLASTERQP